MWALHEQLVGEQELVGIQLPSLELVWGLEEQAEPEVPLEQARGPCWYHTGSMTRNVGQPTKYMIKFYKL